MQVFYHVPNTFLLVIFQVGSCFFAWTILDCNPLTLASQIAGVTGTHHHAQPFY
jgi:hypothetical protein